jgi:hypothetical protein
MSLPRILSLLVLACLLTLLNALKPLHIDDTAYYYYAAQIAEHPLDPYGFAIHWSDRPLPANHILAPVMLPYWWAAAIRLFGDHPFLWKLWLLPISLLLVFALHSLLRRFARGLELPLLGMIVLSPTLLPSFNLMLDVPALALSLTSLAVFISGVERGSWRRAVLAGLIAGVGMETKYTAFLAPCVLLLYGIVHRRPRLGVLAAGTAGTFFVLWEAWIALRYGESHFLFHRRLGPEGIGRLFNLIVPLVGILGGAASTVGLLALAALGVRPRAVIGYGLVLGLGYLLLAWVPGSCSTLLRDAASGRNRLTLNNLVVGPAGLLVCVGVAAAAARLRPFRRLRGRTDRFLVLWLGLELASYFVLTPYMATRRVLGLTLVASLVAGRLAALSCRSTSRRRLVYGVAVLSVVLALVFYEVDYRDAAAQQRAIEEAALWVRQQEPGALIWFTGHWGFQFYAERAGLMPLVVDDPRPRCGEWLVLPDRRMVEDPWPIDLGRAQAVTTLRWSDGVGLRTVPSYYCGNTALEHQEGPRFEVTIYRLTADAPE